jgi:PAS domain S-box-containing protein
VLLASPVSGADTSRHNGLVVEAPTGVPAEHVLAALVEMADDAILVCDRHWRVASWGPGATRLFGRSAGEAVGQPVAALLSVAPEARWSRALEQVEGGAELRHLEVEAKRGDGTTAPVSISLRALHGTFGERAGAVVVVRDDTERVLAQAALAEAQARFERSEALSGVGSWFWDVASGAVQWSAEFHRVHGVDPLSFGGTLDAYLRLVAEEDRARLESALRASAATGAAFEERYRVGLARGGSALVRVRGEPAFGPNGSVVGLRGVGQRVLADDIAAVAGAGGA